MRHPGTMAFLTNNYPNAFQTAQAAADYESALKDLPTAQVLAAVKRLHAESTSEFKPTPGAIRKLIGNGAKYQEPTQEDHEMRKRWDRAESLKSAKSWAGNVDYLERRGMLEHSRSTVIDACETIAKEGAAEDHWLAQRALARLAEIGCPADPAKWQERLQNAEHVPMGSAIGEDLEFGAPERWAEEHT